MTEARAASLSATPAMYRVSRGHALALGACTAASLCVLAVLVFEPEWIFAVLRETEILSWKQLYDNQDQFFLDVVVLWGIGCAVLALDNLSRNTRRSSLFHTLFSTSRDTPGDPEPALLVSTAIVSFVLVPALAFVNLGRFRLNLEWLRMEDGPLETLTFLGLALASYLVGRTALGIRRGVQVVPRPQRVALGAVTFGLLFVFFEEISWGQRVFGWQTPTRLRYLNSQGELNVHNFFNAYFEAAYFVVGLSLFAVVFLGGWKMLTRPQGQGNRSLPGIFPDASLLVLAGTILLFSGHLATQELVEELAAVVAVLYAVRVHSWAGGLGPDSGDTAPSRKAAAFPSSRRHHARPVQAGPPTPTSRRKPPLSSDLG